MSKAGVGTFVLEDHELASNGFALFDTPLVDSSMVHGKFLSIYPATVLKDAGPHEFLIPSDGLDFTYLPYTRLEGCIEIVKTDGGAVTDDQLNAYVNLLPQSLYKQIEVSINGTQIADLSTPTYAFKSFIETILTFPKDVKETTLLLEHFDKDTLGKENIFVVADSDSFHKRHEKVKKGKKKFSMILHIDFFHINRYLLPGCEIKLKMIRNDDKFSLLGATHLTRIKFHELKLQIRRLTAHPSILDGMEKKLATTPAIFPVAQSKIKTFIINRDVKQERISNIFRGVLPRSFIVAFVDSAAYDGAINRNPYCFENYKLNHFQAYINGEPLLTEVMQPDFSNDNFYHEYRHFMDNLGWSHDKESMGITMEEFKTNSFFIPFDLSPDLSNGASLTPLKEGSLDFLISFEEKLPKNIYLLVLATFNEVVLIDKDRNVTLV